MFKFVDTGGELSLFFLCRVLGFILAHDNVTAERGTVT